MARRFYSSVAKGLKIKIRKFWVLIPTFGEVLGEKLVGGWGGLANFELNNFCFHLIFQYFAINLGNIAKHFLL